MRTEEEIQKKADEAADAEKEPKSFGQSYENGVRAALDWVLDEDQEDIL